MIYSDYGFPPQLLQDPPHLTSYTFYLLLENRHIKINIIKYNKITKTSKLELDKTNKKGRGEGGGGEAEKRIHRDTERRMFAHTGILYKHKARCHNIGTKNPKGLLKTPR